MEKMRQQWNYYRAAAGDRVLNNKERPVAVIKHDNTGLWVVENVDGMGLKVVRYDRAGCSKDGRLLCLARTKRYRTPVRRIGYVIGKIKDGKQFFLGHASKETEGAVYYGYWWHDARCSTR